jgi:hypothetical protein
MKKEHGIMVRRRKARRDAIVVSSPISEEGDGRRSQNTMRFVLDSPDVLMRTALQYEHDRSATTIDSRRCE